MRIFTRMVCVLFVVFFMAGAFPKNVQSSNSAVVRFQTLLRFSPPLGFRSAISYGPRYTKNANNIVIEDTNYGVKNPDLERLTSCFGVPLKNLYHAGVDLYRLDGVNAAGSEVTAVADGIIVDYNEAWDYPGEGIVIQHETAPGQLLFSVYMHLRDVPSTIANNQPVRRGDTLGYVLNRSYTGNTPNLHPDDSHLHFEMRLFASAARAYSIRGLTNCNTFGDLPGRGYTLEPPDNFPSPETGYRSPISYLRYYTSVPSVTRSYACTPGYQLIRDNGFEDGEMDWESNNTGYPILTNTSTTNGLPAPHAGIWVAWLGGRNNADDRLFQQFPVGQNVTGAEVSYFVWVGTDETWGSFDHLYVRLRDIDGNLIQEIDHIDNTFAHSRQWYEQYFHLSDWSAWNGQDLQLSFEATTDGSKITNFYLDQVSITTICGGTSQAPAGAQVRQPVSSGTASPKTGPEPVKPTPGASSPTAPRPANSRSNLSPTPFPYPHP